MKKWFWSRLSEAVDATALMSFSRPGYLVHSHSYNREDLDHSLQGKVCIVTGGSSGIGKSVARSLAERGAHVWIVSRDQDRALGTVDELRSQTKNHHIESVVLDVSNLDAVQHFCEHFPRAQVDILVHHTRSALVGSYLMTAGLLGRLKAVDDSRVIFVASARSQVVLAGILSDKQMHNSVSVFSMYPGWVDAPKLPRAAKHFLRTIDEGADTVVWLAVAARGLLQHGQFYFDRKPMLQSWIPGWHESIDIERLRDMCHEAVDARVASIL